MNRKRILTLGTLIVTAITIGLIAKNYFSQSQNMAVSQPIIDQTKTSPKASNSFISDIKMEKSFRSVNDCLTKIDSDYHIEIEKILANRQTMSVTWTVQSNQFATLKLMRQINDSTERGVDQWSLYTVDTEGYPLPLKAQNLRLNFKTDPSELLKQFLALGHLKQVYETFTLNEDFIQGEGSLIDGEISLLALSTLKNKIYCRQQQCHCR